VIKARHLGTTIGVWCVVGAAALSAQSSAPGGTPSTRIDELVKLAADRFREGQTAPPSTAQSQVASPRPVVPLTIDDAVKHALEQNLDIAVERINPQLQDLSMAQLDAAYRPTVTSTLGSSFNRNQGTNQISGGQVIETDNNQYNGGVSQALRWGGGNFTIGWNNTRQESNSNNATINPLFTTNFTASYVQPLLRGFRIDGTRQQIQVTKINRDMSDVQLRATVTTTLANTRNAYWDLVYAVQSVEVTRQSLALAEKLVEDNKMRVEIGTMAEIDVVQAQSEAATRLQALVQAEATRRTAELALKRLIVGGTQDTLWSAELNPVDRPQTAAEPIDLEGAVRNALDKRTDLIQAREQLKSSDITIDYLRNQLLPAVDLTATYGAIGRGGTQLRRSGQGTLGGQVLETIPGGYGDAFAYLRGFDFPNWNVRVDISYPLGNSTAQVSHSRAKLQLQQTQAQLKALELQVATEVTNAALTVQSNLQQVDTARAAAELAQRRLEAEQSKFDVGLSTNFFVVQAQRDLADARNSELRAVLNYRKSLVDFQRVQEAAAGRGGVTAVAGAGGGTGSGAVRAGGGGGGQGGGGNFQ
jgi:outer membrane protein TolC